jgi:DNA-directed RNA polymerase subunit M/transcription elongation factor TFIIS
MKMVHGTTEGINELSQSRKRSLNNNTGGGGASQSNKELRANAIKRVNLSNPIQDNNQLLLSHFGGVPTDLLGEDFDLIDGSNQNNKLLKCPVCEFTTLVSDQLLEHEKQEHSKVKFYRCIKCNYVTHIKTRFSKHVKYHSMPMIKCIICDFRTPYKWNLDRHMKNHGGSGQFKCNVCNFTADIKQSLTVHELNHHVPPLNNGSSGSSTNLCITNRRKDSPDNTFNMAEEHNNTFDMFQNVSLRQELCVE